MARVDPEKLQIIRAREKVVVPERGAELGNFGCARISDDESEPRVIIEERNEDFPVRIFWTF